MLAVLVVAGARSSWPQQSDRFFTVDNLLNQGRLMAEVGLVALPMTFVIITGGIDLSVGSIIGLSPSCSACSGRTSACPCRLAIVLALAIGTLSGVANGWIITRFRVPPLIATLATLALYRGLAEGISQARSVRGYPEWFFLIGQGEMLGVPVQLWILILVAVVAAVILGWTVFGRVTYAIGNNETAAQFSGLPVDPHEAPDLRRLGLHCRRSRR